VNWRGAFVMLRFTPKALDYISYLT
jgi:hypothetical protein